MTREEFVRRRDKSVIAKVGVKLTKIGKLFKSKDGS